MSERVPDPVIVTALIPNNQDHRVDFHHVSVWCLFAKPQRRENGRWPLRYSAGDLSDALTTEPLKHDFTLIIEVGSLEFHTVVLCKRECLTRVDWLR